MITLKLLKVKTKCRNVYEVSLVNKKGVQNDFKDVVRLNETNQTGTFLNGIYNTCFKIAKEFQIRFSIRIRSLAVSYFVTQGSKTLFFT